MIKKIIFIFYFLYSTGVFSKETISEMHLFSIERQGIKLYKKGHYKKALPKLYKTAVWGLKDSQYFLGLMYLKGQHVEQNIVKGMGLIGVSNEAGIKDRIEIFEKVYKALPKSIQLQIDNKVEEYIDAIGLDVKNIKCSKSQDLGSRVPVVNCDYYKVNVGGSFSLD